MNKNRAAKWLKGELPNLVSLGVLDQDTAGKLRAHYDADGKDGLDVAMIVFSVLGAALVGLGIISLLAYNWDLFSRPLRTVISFSPLVAAQIGTGWVLLRRSESMAWKEGTAVFLSLSVGACIALIGQTYQIPGNLGSFLLTWMLLVVPLVYLLNSGATAVGYLAGIAAWAAYAQANDGHALLFWLLSALVVPFIYHSVRRDRYGARSLLLSWSLAIYLCICTGIILERSIPGLWILVYTNLFALMFLVGSYWFSEAETGGQRPFHFVGFVGTAVLALILSFDWTWREIGWGHYRTGTGYHEWAAIADYVLLASLLIAVIALLVVSVRMRRTDVIPVAVAPGVALVGFALSAGSEEAILGAFLFNAYVLVAAVWVMSAGLKRNRLSIVNGGMLWLCALVVLRFFDSEIGFVLRGVAFIVVGAGFLVANVMLAKRMRKAA